MLKRVFFVRPLIVFFFFSLFVDVMATVDVKDPEQQEKQAEKQNFLRENILEKGYDADEFMEFLQSKKVDKELKIEKWTMEELKQVVKDFQEKKPLPANEEINGNEDPVEVNNDNILQTNKKDELEIKNENDNVVTEIIGQNMALSVGSPNLLMQNNQFVQGPNDSINITHDQSSPNRHFYDLSHNEIARGVFDFYRHVGKFLTSLVWSVVNSYCGFEEIVMNDWYCFKYAMCSGYRLQPRFMRSRVWIDMNFNFLEGIAGFLIRFFLFESSYNMYENIFDFFNICIDIKVYNNLYFAVNIVGIVRSIVLLAILGDKFTNPFLQHEIEV